jgi:hypothetical protein
METKGVDEDAMPQGDIAVGIEISDNVPIVLGL